MDGFNTLLTEWWQANSKAVKDHIEDRTGQRPTDTNQVAARRRDWNEESTGEEIYCAVLVFEGEPVAFVTVDWGEPLIKLAWII